MEGKLVDDHSREPDTREKILDAAIGTFMAKGYKDTSMKDIAREAQVNKAMLFYYFSSKDNLYRESIRRMFAKFLVNITKSLDEINTIPDYKDRFCELLKVYAQQFCETRNIVHLIIHAIMNYGECLLPLKEEMTKVRQPLVDMLQEGMNQQIFKKMDPVFTANAILGIFQIFYRLCPGMEPLYDDETIYRNTIDFVFNGILSWRE